MQQVTPEIVQSELPLISLLKAPEALREDILRGFGDEEENAVRFAVRWAWDHRRVKMDQSHAAQHIGVAASHFCNILAGKKYLPPHKINSFEWICGNRAVSMTIERFRVIRENEHSRQLAQVIADQMVKVAA